MVCFHTSVSTPVLNSGGDMRIDSSHTTADSMSSKLTTGKLAMNEIASIGRTTAS